jgi:hypothetical protein
MDARLKHSGMTFFGTFIRLNTYPNLYSLLHFKRESCSFARKQIV